MLFFYRYYGQLCNQLFSILPAYAFALKHKTTLQVVYAEYDYNELFPNLRKSKCIYFWKANKYTNKYVKEIVGYLSKREIIGELRFQSYCCLTNKSIYGWEHRFDESYISEYKSQIVNAFSFSPKVVEKVSCFLGDFKGVNIGVHVRKGDYKIWLGGRYCYDNDTYMRIMRSLHYQFERRGIRCRFVICSNESFEPTGDLIDILRMDNADAIIDLCTLSKCDYIIGPPSTFSQWASFVGDVPLYVITDPDTDLLLEDFSRIIHFDTFENGKHFVWGNDVVAIK